MSVSAPAPPEVSAEGKPESKPTASRIVVSGFGALAALAGIEHGVGEILQGWRAPSSLVIQSWPDTAGFEIVGGEPAMTVVPNLALAGTASVMVALALGIWAIWFIERPRGGLILVGLSLLLLVAGGGFGPPLIGSIVGVVALRTVPTGERPGPVRAALSRIWGWLLGVGVAGYLALVPGMVLLNRFTGFDNASVVTSLIVVSFSGVALSLVAAGAYDRLKGSG